MTNVGIAASKSFFLQGELLAKYCFFLSGFLDNFVTVETQRLVETRGDNLVTVETRGDSWRQFCDDGDSESLTLTVKLDKNLYICILKCLPVPYRQIAEILTIVQSTKGYL